MAIFKIDNQQGGFPAAQWERICLPVQEMQFRSLDRAGLLKEGTAASSSILTWKVPWVGEPGGLQSRGPQRIGHD